MMIATLASYQSHDSQSVLLLDGNLYSISFYTNLSFLLFLAVVQGTSLCPVALVQAAVQLVLQVLLFL